MICLLRVEPVWIGSIVDYRTTKTENRTENTTGEVLPIESMSMMSKIGSPYNHKRTTFKQGYKLCQYQDTVFSGPSVVKTSKPTIMAAAMSKSNLLVWNIVSASVMVYISTCVLLNR